MRVLNVNHTLDPVTGGGTAERTRQMSRWLRRTGVEAATLTTSVGLSSRDIEALTHENVTVLPTISSRFYLPRRSAGRVDELVRDADIVHLMCHWTILNAVVYSAARRRGKAYVVCPAGSLRISGRSRGLKRIYNALIGRRIIRNASAHIAITREEVQQYQAYGVGAERVTVIPNGICPEDFIASDTETFRRTHRLVGRRLVLFVGRLDWVKGPDLLLEAFGAVATRFGEYDLVYVGPDGGMLPRLKKMAMESGLHRRVHFLGYVDGADRSRAYHSADLLVIPSRQEAMSIVVLEAGISGTPVLATDRCGLTEMAAAVAGRVVACSIEGLAKGLVAALAEPGELRRMGERLRRHVADNYTWDTLAKRYLALYEQVLGERHGGPGEQAHAAV